jgi:GT2 family glycosyltransferase
MKVSIVIVSKNRKEDLRYTLNKINSTLDLRAHEVLVLLDGCDDGSEILIDEFDWVSWTRLFTSVGASRARKLLYEKAVGDYFIGLDDDAHPLNLDFIEQVCLIFAKYTNTGIIAFQELKGVFKSDLEALQLSSKDRVEYFTNEFIGSGFAIRKSVYFNTNGFPTWLDIYGEESCVAIEVLANGYDIIYTNSIKINHRVDIEARKVNKQNYYRFGKQLKNSSNYFIVYYPNPFLALLKLYWHNFKKYALTDFRCFTIYFRTVGAVLIQFPAVLKFRRPVKKEVLYKMRRLKGLKY